MTRTPFTALECRVGLGRVLVDAADIELVAEYPVSAPLPYASRLTYALGAWQGELLLSICMTRPTAERARPAVGLVMRHPGATRWAFEIAAPVGLVEVVALARPQSDATRWLRTASLASGVSVQLVDVATLIEELEAAPRPRGGA